MARNAASLCAERRIERLLGGKPVQCANDCGDESVPTSVTSIVKHVELACPPSLRQLPCGIERAADVVTALMSAALQPNLLSHAIAI
jgi:hypothetical protein